MAFCEQCGNKLTPGTRFCEECGAEVEFEEINGAPPKDVANRTDGLKDIFCTFEWKNEWERVASNAGNNELGLILTREEELLLQIGASPVELQNLLVDYIDKANERGVKYYYLNLDKFPEYVGDGTSDSVVEALCSIVDVARFKYLFILGNEQVVDVVRWTNEANDGDEEVESDLCYMTLDKESPWMGQQYDFDEIIRVGRLPTYQGEGFDNFRIYFESAIKNVGQMCRLIPYGLSALVWQEESDYEFGKVASRGVDVSPQVGNSNVSAHMGHEVNLLFFNLHGSDRAKYWYGQDGGNYPEAFSPSVLRKMARPYFLGVEACYGARYLGGLTPDDSIVLTAVQNHCIAFLGSSKIAFGTSTPTGSCADLVVGSYIKEVSLGESAGDAHIAGLKRLAAGGWDLMDDADIKTMAEFALYGDPSARKGTNNNIQKLKNQSSSLRVRKGLSIPTPDVRRAVHSAIAEVDAKIEALVDDYVKREVFPECPSAIGSEGIQTKVMKMTKSGLNQKIYSLNVGILNKVAKLYFDDKGCICKALVSK